MAKMVVSKKWSLVKEDLKKVGIGALMAGSGAILIYLADWLSTVEIAESMYSPIIAAVISVIVNMLRKYASETKYK